MRRNGIIILQILFNERKRYREFSISMIYPSIFFTFSIFLIKSKLEESWDHFVSKIVTFRSNEVALRWRWLKTKRFFEQNKKKTPRIVINFNLKWYDSSIRDLIYLV